MHELRHLVGRLDVERQCGDDAESSERDDGTTEVGVVPGQGDDVAGA